jgi:predicted ester cyclase
MGFQPTGREVTFTGMRLFRIPENKIAESWVTMDAQGWQEQLEEEAQLGTRRLHFHRSS